MLVGTVYWQLDNSVAGFQSRMGLIFYVFLVFNLMSLTSLEMFMSERNLFVRERANGFYSVSIYFVTKVNRSTFYRLLN